MSAHSHYVVIYKTPKTRVRVLNDKESLYLAEGATKYWGTKTYESNTGFSLVEITSSVHRSEWVRTESIYSSVAQWGISEKKDAGVIKLVIDNKYIEET